MSQKSLLELSREQFKNKVPHLLQDFSALSFKKEPLEKKENKFSAELEKVFPRLFSSPKLVLISNQKKSHTPLKVGIVLSGGQAPGGHNVIAGLYDGLKKLNSESTLIGFKNGPAGIIENKWIALDDLLVNKYRNQGGFDMIGSGRTKIETPDQFKAALETIRKNSLNGLVIVGGDDSNTNAALLAEYFLKEGESCAVIGAPKTIDGDLKNEQIEISFGFDTATKIYSEAIGNIAKDALSQRKYTFIIKVMGRSASHVALECALKTHPNMTLIGEEIAERKLTLNQLLNEIADLVEKRAKMGKNYGVILLPEGLIEFIPEFKQLIKELNSFLNKEKELNNDEEDFSAVQKALSVDSRKCFNLIPKEIQKQLLLERDPHGNVQVSKIESDRLVIELLKKELKKRDPSGKIIKFNPQGLFLGYEGRSGFPSNFDCTYTYALGLTAALLIEEKATGFMACIQSLHLPAQDWRVAGIPLVSMMTMEERGGKLKPVIEKKLVELNSAPFVEFQTKRPEWELNDEYQMPGPIQFFGPLEITDEISETLKLESL